MAEAPRPKKTFRMPSAAPPKAPQPPPPPPAWKSGGETADVYYDTRDAFYKMTGMNALQQNLEMLPEYLQDVAGTEMANIAADVIANAKNGFVPWKLGHLSDSGRSDDYEPGQGVGITEIGMWFGGPPDAGGGGAAMSAAVVEQEGLSVIDPSKYALVQHEDLSFNHPMGGGAKYLEKPLLAMLPNILPRLAKAINEANANVGTEALTQPYYATGLRGESGLGPMGGPESSL